MIHILERTKEDGKNFVVPLRIIEDEYMGFF